MPERTLVGYNHGQTSPLSRSKQTEPGAAQRTLDSEYAALLVDPGYHPPPTLDTAPMQGGSIAAVELVKGTGGVQLAPTKPLSQWI